MRAFKGILGITGELFQYFWHRKLWWMMPLMVVLLLFGVIIALASASAIGPFIYTLF